MAFQLYISDGTTTINLANTTGFQSSEPYFQMSAIPTGDGSIPEYVTETIPVVIHITTDNNLAATMQDFHALQVRAAEYWQDPDANTPVWFYRQLAAETSATRTLVRTLAYEPTQELEGSYMADVPCVSEGRTGEIIITHHPYNEHTTTTIAAGATIDYLGGTKTINSVPGDVPARISLLAFTGSMGMDWDRGVWIGIRSNGKNGVTLANVVTLWEAEDAANGTNSSDTVGGAGDSGGDYVTTTTYGATWGTVSRYILGDFDGGNTSDHFGTWLFLLRAALSAGSTEVAVRANLYTGGTGGANFAHQNEPVYITSTSYGFYNLGPVTFPLAGLKGVTPSMDASDDTVGVEAYWMSGTADLYTDCAVIIPIDEAWLAVHPGRTGYAILAATDEYEFGVLPNDDHTPFAHLSTTGAVKYLPVPSVSPSFGLRPGSNLLVYANSVTPAQADCTLAVSYFPRWVTLRGAE